jgi:hypothetical protein
MPWEVDMLSVVLSILGGRGAETDTVQENYSHFTEYFRENAPRSIAALPTSTSSFRGEVQCYISARRKSIMQI